MRAGDRAKPKLNEPLWPSCRRGVVQYRFAGRWPPNHIATGRATIDTANRPCCPIPQVMMATEYEMQAAGAGAVRACLRKSVTLPLKPLNGLGMLLINIKNVDCLASRYCHQRAWMLLIEFL